MPSELMWRILAGKTFDLILRGLIDCWGSSSGLSQGENRFTCGEIVTDIFDEMATVMLTAGNASAALVLSEAERRRLMEPEFRLAMPSRTIAGEKVNDQRCYRFEHSFIFAARPIKTSWAL
jgi:hypothetical protein